MIAATYSERGLGNTLAARTNHTQIGEAAWKCRYSNTRSAGSIGAGRDQVLPAHFPKNLMSANGAFMRNSLLQAISRCAVWSLCLTWALSSIALAQDSFEVASVKPHGPGDEAGTPPICENNRFSVRKGSIQGLLTWAHDLRMDQILVLEASLPPWARTEGYDIEAVANKRMDASQCKQAVQRLIADRFKMKSHWKTITNSPGYDLTVAPQGHKLRPADPTDTDCGVHISYEGQERPCNRYQFPFAVKRSISMEQFANTLSIYMGQYPVRNKTGLSGEYKIDLSFTKRSDHPVYLPLEMALQKQLGLVLRSSKADANVLIVDSVERPTAN